MSFFKVAPSLYENVGPEAKLPGNIDEIRFVCFEEADQGRKQPRLAGARTKLVCVDSGQVEETLSPPCIAKRCCKRPKSNGNGVVWTWRVHDLDIAQRLKEANWRRS